MNRNSSVAGLRAHAAKCSASKKRVAKKQGCRIRRAGTPPPVSFDFDALPDSARLTSDEVAGVLRVSITTPPSWRRIAAHALEWEYVNDKPLYTVGNLRAFMALGKKSADDG